MITRSFGVARRSEKFGKSKIPTMRPNLGETDDYTAVAQGKAPPRATTKPNPSDHFNKSSAAQRPTIQPHSPFPETIPVTVFSSLSPVATPYLFALLERSQPTLCN